MRTIIFVHIPKTGGTSLAYVFEAATDRRVLFDYKADYGNVLFSNDVEEDEFRRAVPFVRRHFRFIHGHFYLKKYDRVLQESPKSTCFRDPVERTLSHFKHILRDANPQQWEYRAMQEGLNPADFAALEEFRTPQIRHMGGADPADLDFIFLSENLDEGLALFHRRFPGHMEDWPTVPRLNEADVRPSASMLPMPPYDEAGLRRALAEEIDYYRRAQAVYAAQRARLAA